MKWLQLTDRYLARELGKGYLVVAVILVALFSLLGLLEELEDVGDGRYSLARALGFVLMTLPSRLLRLLPFITLLGGCLALWQLARRSELTVLRAAGISPLRLAWPVALPATTLLVLVPLTYEYVAPTLYEGATLSREAAIGEGELLREHGFWSRRGDTLVHVGGLSHGRVPTDVMIFEWSRDGRLERFTRAQTADPQPDGRWRLVDVERRTYDARTVAHERRASLVWQPWWNEEVPMYTPPVEGLSFTDMRGYIRYLERTGQPTARYNLAYWRAWLLPVTALLTALLAVPLVVGGTRDASGARHLGFAALGGLVYYFSERIVAFVGLLAALPPVLIALLPVLGLGVVVGVLLRWAR